MAGTDDTVYGKAVEKSMKLLEGKVDTLVLNHVASAGNYERGGWYGKHDMKTLQTMFAINLFSHISLGQQYLSVLEESHGKIISVGSAAGRVGLPNVAPYSASKHGLFGYFESLRHDLGKVGSNITISTCTIGSINTENARKVSRLQQVHTCI